MERKSDSGDSGDTALLIIDMINLFDFDGAEALLPRAEAAAERLAALKARAKGALVPVVYVNDNYGHWNSNFEDTVKAARKSPGRKIARLLKPGPEDYSVLKSGNSGFYGTPLELLLAHLSVRRLIVGGVATNICVLYTVHDAHMRRFAVTVASDGVAAEDEASHLFALSQMETVLGVQAERADAVTFG